MRRSRKEPFVSHYLESYQKLPIWVAIEIWDFGALSKLFSGLKQVDKDFIAAKYGVFSGDDFAGWLRGLNFVRNVCAHHSRLWNINMLERAKVWDKDMYWQQQNNAKRDLPKFKLVNKGKKIIRHFS
jgi:abortive infection bacteriophage resistance protein